MITSGDFPLLPVTQVLFIFKPGKSKITKYRIETTLATEKPVVSITTEELTEDLIVTFEDKIVRIDFEALESFRKRLGRQIIRDKCGFQIAPNNMEKFSDFKMIALDREAQLTPLGTVFRFRTLFRTQFCDPRFLGLSQKL